MSFRNLPVNSTCADHHAYMYARAPEGYGYYNAPPPPHLHHYAHHSACNAAVTHHHYLPGAVPQKGASAPIVRSNEAEQDAVEILLNMRNS